MSKPRQHGKNTVHVLLYLTSLHVLDLLDTLMLPREELRISYLVERLSVCQLCFTIKVLFMLVEKTRDMLDRPFGELNKVTTICTSVSQGKTETWERLTTGAQESLTNLVRLCSPQ